VAPAATPYGAAAERHVVRALSRIKNMISVSFILATTLWIGLATGSILDGKSKPTHCLVMKTWRSETPISGDVWIFERMGTRYITVESPLTESQTVVLEDSENAWPIFTLRQETNGHVKVYQFVTTEETSGGRYEGTFSGSLNGVGRMDMSGHFVLIRQMHALGENESIQRSN
jgi:hypothetical protein